jgi:hypothetical protein
MAFAPPTGLVVGDIFNSNGIIYVVEAVVDNAATPGKYVYKPGGGGGGGTTSVITANGDATYSHDNGAGSATVIEPIEEYLALGLTCTGLNTIS